ncbi:hypothetical protein FRC10_003285, partial [Ceratobasidium sp. 414]
MPAFDDIAALLSSPHRPPPRQHPTTKSTPPTPSRRRTQYVHHTAQDRAPIRTPTPLFKLIPDHEQDDPLTHNINRALSKSFAPSTISNYTGE